MNLLIQANDVSSRFHHERISSIRRGYINEEIKSSKGILNFTFVLGLKRPMLTFHRKRTSAIIRDVRFPQANFTEATDIDLIKIPQVQA